MNTILPLANWGNGTILIAIFGVVCIALVAIVLSFVFGSKEKGEDSLTAEETNPLNKENHDN